MQLASETKEGLTRTWQYDYQEGTTIQALAANMGIAENVAQTIFAGVSLNLGDLNNDGATDAAEGTLVRIEEPPVHDIDGAAQSVVRRFRSNEYGQIVSEFDPLGVESRYTYYAFGDQRGMLETKVVDPAGLALTDTYTYDTVGNVIAHTDAAGGTTHFTYDDLNQVVQITDSSGAITKRFFDSDGNLIRIDRPGDASSGDLWVSTKYTYNQLNRPILREDEKSADTYVVTEYRYDLNENRSRVIKPMGNSALTEYDERDLPMVVKQGYKSQDQAKETFAYDANGNLVKHVDGAGAVTEYRYDGHDRLVEVTDPTGARTVTEYDAFDRPTLVSHYGVPDVGGDPDTLLAREAAVYDEIGRQIAARRYAVTGGTAGASIESEFYYDAAGRKTLAVDPEGNTTQFAYDAAGRTTTERDAVGNEKEYGYDGAGRPTLITSREINELTAGVEEYTEAMTYDKMGRVVAHEDALGHVARFAYDGRGNLLWKADEMGAPGLDTGGDAGPGNVTQYKYDGLDRKLEETKEMRANGAGSGGVVGTIKTLHAWDDNGNQVSIADANGNTTAYAYDALDRQVRIALPDGAAYGAEYDKASRPVILTDPRGFTVRNTYDGAGRLLMRSASMGAVATRFDAFEYDGLGRLIEAETQDGAGIVTSRVEQGYDSLGRRDLSRQGGIAVTRTYDDADRLAGVSVQNGISAAYDRDAIGRISTVTEGALGELVSKLYSGPARAVQSTLGNGFTINRSYDAMARLVAVNVLDPSSALQAGFETGYDRAGNRLYEKRSHEGGAGEVFAYDRLYRLTAASRGVANPETFAGQSTPANFSSLSNWSIDDVHNWTARVDYRNPADPALNVTRAFTVNDLNQYPTVSESIDLAPPTDTSFLYDEAGNLISDGTYDYTYDDRNLVTEVRNSSDGTLVARYGYDALKRRISEERSSGQIKTYVYDDWQVVAEYTGGVETASFIYDDGIDHPIAMITDAHTYYYHTDTRNNIAMMTNESGAVIERYTYDPYGKVTITDGSGTELNESAIGNPYMYSSRRYDETTGLYYYRNRMYSPELGRFLQRDPEWYSDSVNIYAYVGDNPIRWIDPFGLNKVETDLQGYTDEDFGKAFEAAGIVIDASNVTVTSLRALSLSGKALISASAAVTAVGSLYSAYGLYDGIVSGDTLNALVSGADLAVGIATLAIASESPGGAAALTIFYVGGKWGILTTSDDYVNAYPLTPRSGGAGASDTWDR
jgi:RHS repeat-associated protein